MLSKLMRVASACLTYLWLCASVQAAVQFSQPTTTSYLLLGNGPIQLQPIGENVQVYVGATPPTRNTVGTQVNSSDPPFTTSQTVGVYVKATNNSGLGGVVWQGSPSGVIPILPNPLQTCQTFTNNALQGQLFITGNLANAAIGCILQYIVPSMGSYNSQGQWQPTTGTITPVITPPTFTALGGVLQATVPTHNWVTGVDANGHFTYGQPQAADIAGLAASATTDATNAVNITTGIIAQARLPLAGLGSIGAVYGGQAPVNQVMTGFSNGVPQYTSITATMISGLAPSATTDTTNASNLSSGTVPQGRLPIATATQLGMVKAASPIAHVFLTGIDPTTGSPTASQPNFTDIGSVLAHAQLPQDIPQGFGIAGAGNGNSPPYVEPPSMPANSFTGMDATGNTDTHAVLQTALSLAASLHMPLRLCGTYNIGTSTLSLNSSDGTANTGSGIVGCSGQGATLVSTSATVDMVDMSGASFGLMQQCVVQNVRFTSTVTRTAGTMLKFTNAQRCKASYNQFTAYFHGIDSFNSALNEYDHNSFLVGTANSTQAGSQAVGLYGADVNSYVHSNYADNTSTVANMPTVGLGIYNNVNGEYVYDNSFSKFQYGLFVNAGPNEKIQNIFFRHNAFDISGLYSSLFQTGTGSGAQGNIYRIFSVEDWFAATQQGPGMRFQGDGQMGAITLDSPIVRSNFSDGIQLAGNVSGGFQVNNPMVTANNDAATPNHQTGISSGCAGTSVSAGINISDVRVKASFVGGKIGPTAEEFACQSYAFSMQNGVDYIDVKNMDLSGNVTGPMIFGTLGSHNTFTNNRGYNPVASGGGSVTVGASPWTYTAGPSPETIYVFAGTCSLVSQYTGPAASGTGVGINNACSTMAGYQLGPNESLQVTYSVAPVVNRLVH